MLFLKFFNLTVTTILGQRIQKYHTWKTHFGKKLLPRTESKSAAMIIEAMNT